MICQYTNLSVLNRLSISVLVATIADLGQEIKELLLVRYQTGGYAMQPNMFHFTLLITLHFNHRQLLK